MEHIKRVILNTIPDGVLKRLTETDLILIPPNFEDNVFDKAVIDIELPNLSMKMERFVDTNHWWIGEEGDEYYTYYTPEEMNSILEEEIAKSIAWIKIQ
jgi:hypothetical protein